MGPLQRCFSHAPVPGLGGLKHLGLEHLGVLGHLYVQASPVISAAWCLQGSWASYWVAQGFHISFSQERTTGKPFLTQPWKSHGITSAHY